MAKKKKIIMAAFLFMVFNRRAKYSDNTAQPGSGQSNKHTAEYQVFCLLSWAGAKSTLQKNRLMETVQNSSGKKP